MADSEENKQENTNSDGPTGRRVKQHGPMNAFGGPHHVGDPDDKRLRIAEKDLYIGKMRRDRAYALCDDIVQEFLKCAETGAVNMLVRRHCKEEKKRMNDCLLEKFHDKEIKQQVVDKYIELRTEYRRTGLTLKQRNEIKANAEALLAGKPIYAKKNVFGDWESTDN